MWSSNIRVDFCPTYRADCSTWVALVVRRGSRETAERGIPVNVNAINAGQCDVVGPREERALVLGRASDSEASNTNLLDVAPVGIEALAP